MQANNNYYNLSILLVVRVLLGQIAQLHFQSRYLSLLVIQSQLDLLNLLLDQRELLIRQVSVFRP